jgi:hypothetical protein
MLIFWPANFGDQLGRSSLSSAGQSTPYEESEQPMKLLSGYKRLLALADGLPEVNEG